MKSPGTIALALATPLVIAAGFCLPDIVCRLQDDARSVAVSRHDAQPVQLDIEHSDSTLHALQTFAFGAVLYDLDETGRTNSHDVRAAVSDVLPPFSVFSSLDPAECTVEETPMLAVSGDGSRAAVLWNCTLASGADDAAVISVLIDDATGKVVKLTCYAREPEAEEPTASPKDFDAWIRDWASHLGVDAEMGLAIDDSAPSASAEADADDAVTVDASIESACARIPGTELGLQAQQQAFEGFQTVYLLLPVRIEPVQDPLG